MALTLEEVRGLIRGELRVGASELPDALLTSYTNQIQSEVATMLGPVVEPILRKRAAISGATSASEINDGAGSYTDATGVITGFTGLVVDAHIDDEVVFDGTFTAVELAYKDIITDNDATTITVAKNSKAGDNGSTVTAIIIATPSAVDPGTAGFDLPADCLKPLYLSDSTTPSSEKRIKIIQIDDTEQFIENAWYDAEMRAGIHVGNTVRLLKGSSASFPATTVLTYVMRPTAYSSDSDEMLQSEGRLPEEYFGAMRSGILRLANMHLGHEADMRVAGDDFTARLTSIQNAFGASQAQEQREKRTQ